MPDFSLSQLSMPAIVDQEFLAEFLAEDFDKPTLNKIVSMSDLKEHAQSLRSFDGTSYYDLCYGFLSSVIPDYSPNHPVNDNLGNISKKDETFNFWGAGVYFSKDDGLFLQIGSKDANHESYKLLFEFDIDRSTYVIPGQPARITQSWKRESYDRLGNETSYVMLFHLLNPTASYPESKKRLPVNSFSIRVRCAKLADDNGATVTNQLATALYDNETDLSELIASPSTGGSGTIAKSSFLSDYYINKVIIKFAIKVVDVELVTRPEFIQMIAHVDMSDCADVIVRKVDFSKNSPYLHCSIREVTKLQFGAGKKEKPTKLYEKFLKLEEENQAITEGKMSEADRTLLPPFVNNPWIITFDSLPRNPEHTPSYTVWVKKVKPVFIQRLLDESASIEFFGGRSIQQVIAGSSAAVDVSLAKLDQAKSAYTIPALTDSEVSDYDSSNEF